MKPTLLIAALIGLAYMQSHAQELSKDSLAATPNVAPMADPPGGGGGGTPPPNPSTPTVSSNTCGNKVVTRGTPPAGVVWYWQTTAGGTSIANSSTTYTVTTEGSKTVYLRAHRPSAGLWSNGYSYVSFTVKPIPAQPAVPSVSNQCGQSVLTRGTPPSSPSGNTWYWQGDNPNGTSTSNSSSSYTVTTSDTYYLRARSSAGCWSTSSASVAVTVKSKPSTPPNPSSSGNTCGAVTLTYSGTPPSNVRWYWQTSASGTSTSLGYDTPKGVTASASYYLRAYNTVSSCWSDLSSGPVVVTYNPAVSAPAPANVTREEPGPATLTATIGANGTTNKWFDGPSGGSELGTGTAFNTVVSGTTTFYVSSYNETSGCESSRVPVTVTVTPKPVISYTGLYIILGKSITLSVENNTYSTYAWKLDGVPVGGNTSSIAVSNPGVYTVTVTKTGMTGGGTSGPVTILSIGINSVGATYVQKEGVTSASTVSTLATNEKAKTISYFGGLGNGLQTIQSEVSPLQKDIVVPVEYDALGRQIKHYLPYASQYDDGEYRFYALSNGGYTNSEQYQFYQTAAKIDHDTKPYGIAEPEPSPMGRVLAQTGVGADWHTGQKKMMREYILNRSADGIRIWSVNTSGLPVSTAVYPDYQLYGDVTTDENGNKRKTWTDKTGHIILTEVQADATNWLKTYHIYGNLGRLAFTLSPEGTRAGNYSPNQAFLDQWAFQYRYDNLNRLVEYKAPAAGWIYTVYDELNRPVMTQNADQRSRSEWGFVKYDIHGRAVVTGYKAIPSSTRSSVQTAVDGQAYQFEVTATSAVGYTLNRTYPTTLTEADLLSVSYYDNYTFLTYTGWDAESHSFSFVPEQGSTAHSAAVNGLPTGAKIRIVNTSTWLNAVQYYDKYYRPLQVIAENHLGGLDRNTNKYNNLRQLSEARLSHHNGSIVVLRKFNYDHAGRITKIYQNINSAPSDQLVAQYEYNELGQVVDKKLHNTTGASFLQSVDYRYTIRGWMASINNSQLNVNSANNDETDDLFGMEFLYSEAAAGMGNTQYYNGNVSAVKWKGPVDGSGTQDQKSYKYGYDKSDRLLTAASQMYNGSAWTKEAGVLNESMTYDHNGNVKTLLRNHRKHQLSGLTVSYVQETVDNLTYTYSGTQGNQVAKVEDAVAVSTGTGDFKNNANLTTEYTYNADGGLTADKNKGIDSVHYNMLGKVRRIKFTDGRVITYLYDAGGSKLKMKNYDTNQDLEKTTDYVNGFVYTDGALSFFGSPEGRVVKKGSAFEYEYAIADQQGNTRVVFTSAAQTPDSPTATFEGDGGDGASQYTNINPSNVVTFIGANHTAGGSKVIRMNQTYKIGPSKSIKVFPGDKVDIEVWEYHEGSSGFGTTSTPLTTLITMVSGAFGGVSGGGGESGLIYSGVNAAINLFVPGGNQGTDRPAAYLNYILFDKNYSLIDMGWQPAPAATFTKQKLSFNTINVKGAGYLFVYLSYDNDSNNWVYFDDFKVTHTPTNVIQYNEYYPFGLQTSNSWTRENSNNDYLYNAGNELNGNSGWYETFFRGYDPALGRFLQADPLAYASSSHTPYSYAFNDPVVYNDPMGDYPPSVYIDRYENGSGGGSNDGFGSEGFFNSTQGFNAGPPIYQNGQLMNPRGMNGVRYWAGTALEHSIYQGAVSGYGSAAGISVGGRPLSSYSQTSSGGYVMDVCSGCGGYAGGLVYGEYDGNGTLLRMNSLSYYEDTYTYFPGYAQQGSDSPWYEFFADHNPGGDFLYELNKWNPIANAYNAVSTYLTGQDSYGVQQSNATATIQLASVVPIGKFAQVGKGLSTGLAALFKNGVSNNSIINIRSTLLGNGFTQAITKNGSGYLFTNSLGEQVRIMSRNGGWDVRIMNQYGNYLDNLGGIAPPSKTHGIFIFSK